MFGDRILLLWQQARPLVRGLSRYTSVNTFNAKNITSAKYTHTLYRRHWEVWQMQAPSFRQMFFGPVWCVPFDTSVQFRRPGAPVPEKFLTNWLRNTTGNYFFSDQLSLQLSLSCCRMQAARGLRQYHSKSNCYSMTTAAGRGPSQGVYHQASLIKEKLSCRVGSLPAENEIVHHSRPVSRHEGHGVAKEGILMETAIDGWTWGVFAGKLTQDRSTKGNGRGR